MSFKNILPRPIYDILWKWQDSRRISSLARCWRSARASNDLGEKTSVNGILKRILIAPTDPWTLTGSLGDEAMISSVVERAKSISSAVCFDIITANDDADNLARARNLNPIQLWNSVDYVGACIALMRDGSYDAVITLGADVVDGYYGGLTAAKLLILSDLAARQGLPTSLLGFSFNASPNPGLKQIFNELHPGVRANVRDKFSLDRFSAFTSAQGFLAADAAFLLNPSLGDNRFVENAKNWIEERRQAGDKVIGFNVHPMLFKNATAREIASINASAVQLLTRVNKQRKVSWLLIPHDYRDDCGDRICLVPLFDQLKNIFAKKIFMLEGDHRASSLKAVSSLLDGVVTGRMHLAIGTLGSGVPVLAISYQDKFEGLFLHFELSPELIMSPSDFVIKDKSMDVIKFIDNVGILKTQIAKKLPKVLAAAELNFSILR